MHMCIIIVCTLYIYKNTEKYRNHLVRNLRGTEYYQRAQKCFLRDENRKGNWVHVFRH